MAEITSSSELAHIATSDVLWDEVVEITPLGEKPTFDATIENTHNFVADGVVVHNSIEQDADMVMFLYRDEYYNPTLTIKGIAEVIIGKHRNGPTGKVQLAWLEQYTSSPRWRAAAACLPPSKRSSKCFERGATMLKLIS
jgi:replicative DNA helicase